MPKDLKSIVTDPDFKLLTDRKLRRALLEEADPDVKALDDENFDKLVSGNEAPEPELGSSELDKPNLTQRYNSAKIKQPSLPARGSDRFSTSPGKAPRAFGSGYGSLEEVAPASGPAVPPPSVSSVRSIVERDPRFQRPQEAQRAVEEAGPVSPQPNEYVKSLRDIPSGLMQLAARDASDPAAQHTDYEHRLQGLHRTLTGGFNAVTPFLPAMLAGRLSTLGGAAATAAEFAGGAALQHGAGSAAKALGAGPGLSGVIGDIAGAAPIFGRLGRGIESALEPRKARALPEALGSKAAENDAVRSTLDEFAKRDEVPRAPEATPSDPITSEYAAIEKLRGNAQEPVTSDVPEEPVASATTQPQTPEDILHSAITDSSDDPLGSFIPALREKTGLDKETFDAAAQSMIARSELRPSRHDRTGSTMSPEEQASYIPAPDRPEAEGRTGEFYHVLFDTGKRPVPVDHEIAPVPEASRPIEKILSGTQDFPSAWTSNAATRPEPLLAEPPVEAVPAVKPKRVRKPKAGEVPPQEGFLTPAETATQDVLATTPVAGKKAKPKIKLQVSPETPVTSVEEQVALKELQRQLPGLKITRDLQADSIETPGETPGKKTFFLRTPGGSSAKILVQPEIPFEPSEVPKGMKPTGGYVDGNAVILIANNGLVTGAPQHEVLHFALDKLLYPKERQVLLDAFNGREEDIASAFSLNGPDPTGIMQSLRGRLQALSQYLMPSAPGVLDRLQRTNNSSIWERQRGTDTSPVFNIARDVSEFLSSGQQRLRDDPEFYKKAVAPTVARQKWKAIVAEAGPEIARVANLAGIKNNIGWDVVRDMLIDSRLAGIQRRFQDLIAKLNSASDATIVKHSKKGELDQRDGDLYAILDMMDNMQGTKARVTTLTKYLSEGDIEGARSYLFGNFNASVNMINRLDLKGRYGLDLQELSNIPELQQAIGLYKARIERPAAEQHAVNEGFFSSPEHLGPLSTYYPLSVKTDSAPGLMKTLRERSNWFRPDNPLNHFAFGNAAVYDPSIEALASRLGSAEHKNRLSEFMRFMLENNIAVKGTGLVPKELTVRGETVPVKAYALSSLGSLGLTRKAFGENVPQWVALPTVLDQSIGHIMSGKTINDGAIRLLADGLVGYNLLGPFDNVFHTALILSGVQAGVPVLNTGTKLGDFVFNLPFIKNIAALPLVYNRGKFLQTPEGARWYQEEVIPGGYANPRAGQVTTDKFAAREGGLEYLPHPGQKDYWKLDSGFTPEEVEAIRAEKRTFGVTGAKAWAITQQKAEGMFGAFTYGPHGLDTAARRVLYEYHKTNFPNASPKDLADFVNQVGNYNWYLQGQMERALKSNIVGNIVAPFYTAGSTGIRNGLRMALGMVPGLPRGDFWNSAQAKVASTVTGGLLSYAMLWAGLNKAITGNWPWSEEEKGRARIDKLRIPIEVVEKSPVLKAALLKIGGDPQGRDYYVNLAWANPQAVRGLGALGATKGTESYQLGARDATQLMWRAVQGSVNTLMQPLTSGPVRIPMAMAGYSPSLTSVYDRSGEWAPSLRVHRQPAKSNFGEINNALGRGMYAANPLIASAGQAGLEAFTGRQWDPGPQGQQTADPFYQNLVQMIAPRLYVSAPNVEAQSENELRVQFGRGKRRAQATELIEEAERKARSK